MEKNIKEKTLEEFLDELGAGPGDDRSFVLFESPYTNTEMQVSRRYLEGPVYKHLLKKHIWLCKTAIDIFTGEECLAIVLAEN